MEGYLTLPGSGPLDKGIRIQPHRLPDPLQPIPLEQLQQPLQQPPDGSGPSVNSG